MLIGEITRHLDDRSCHLINIYILFLLGAHGTCAEAVRLHWQSLVLGHSDHTEGWVNQRLRYATTLPATSVLAQGGGCPFWGHWPSPGCQHLPTNPTTAARGFSGWRASPCRSTLQAGLAGASRGMRTYPARSGNALPPAISAVGRALRMSPSGSSARSPPRRSRRAPARVLTRPRILPVELHLYRPRIA